MPHEPMTIDTDEPKEALRQIASYLRTVTMHKSRAVLDEEGNIEGYYQLTEWLQGLIEIAGECDRIIAIPELSPQ